MQTALVILTVIIVGYTLTMFVAGATIRHDRGEAPDGLRFVILIPCLDEGLVIGRTIDRLLALRTRHRFAVMIIDDGSTDDTADVVDRYDDDRVWLFQRTAPEARQGKGEALNAAYRALRAKVEAGGTSPDDVIIVVLDADGRLDANALDAVAPSFAEDDRAAVQIKVRIHNAPDGIIARLQDIEFASFTEVFQRGRSRLGAAGLGGNGQFARLSALMDLGDSPWSDCLTEDLELGINFLLDGWRNDFCPDVAVSQQGVTDVRSLVRQRTRWYQGHLQCLRFLPSILRSDLRPWAKFDLSFHLLNAVVMLVLQTVSLVWIGAVAYLVATQPAATTSAMFGGARILVLYALAFGLAPFVAVIYWRTEPTVSIPRGILYAHLYVLYGYLWYFAGVRATFRHLTGQRAWAKTARTAGTGDELAAGRRVIGLHILPNRGGAPARSLRPEGQRHAGRPPARQPLPVIDLRPFDDHPPATAPREPVSSR